MRSRSRFIKYTLGCIALSYSFAGTLSAEDGATLYTQLCATCHDTGLERAPNREAFRAMTSERVLAALESGAMLSMASGRTGVERRAIAEFVTGKSFAQALSNTPSPQAMCRGGSGDFSNPLAGPVWNSWGVNTSNTRFQDTAMAGFTAAQAPRLKVKWAFGFPGELSSDSQPTIAGGRVFAGTQSGVVYSLSAATGCVHWFFQADAAVRAAVSIGRIETNSGPRYVAFIGDRAANDPTVLDRGHALVERRAGHEHGAEHVLGRVPGRRRRARPCRGRTAEPEEVALGGGRDLPPPAVDHRPALPPHQDLRAVQEDGVRHRCPVTVGFHCVDADRGVGLQPRQLGDLHASRLVAPSQHALPKQRESRNGAKAGQHDRHGAGKREKTVEHPTTLYRFGVQEWSMKRKAMGP